MGRRSKRESAKSKASGKLAKSEKPKVRTVHLFDGETIVLIARPARTVTGHKYLFTLGLYSIWRKRTTFVLTDRRILIGSGVFVRTEKSIPLDRIDDAVYLRRGVSSYSEVVFSKRGSRAVERIGPLTPLAARRFTDAVLAHT
jgi:Bacterial PH domain